MKVDLRPCKDAAAALRMLAPDLNQDFPELFLAVADDLEAITAVNPLEIEEIAANRKTLEVVGTIFIGVSLPDYLKYETQELEDAGQMFSAIEDSGLRDAVIRREMASQICSLGKALFSVEEQLYGDGRVS
jgi:hypothetical protein